MINKRTFASLVVASTLATVSHPALCAPDPVVIDLLSKRLDDIPGEEILVRTVTYSPGASEPIHRHEAHGFIYVLEGTFVMAVKGGKEVTLMPGDVFYEGPNDLHTIARNDSKVNSAKYLFYALKKKGVAPVILE